MIRDWQKVQSLFLEALEVPPETRARFLDQACAGDSELRREVESLLAHDTTSEQWLQDALHQTAREMLVSVTIQPGTRIGDYEVKALIGSGGMGEVYQARDLLLARDVAIKVLPAFLTRDPERVRRFEQEAQAAAALNHPNILAVYQMGSFGDTLYLVSELLHGKTLREHIRGGALSPRTAIDYAVQIARGLSAAHAKGIAHRDLKPENLFVTEEGCVKILDFGLAKLTRQELGPQTPATQEGMILGTLGYMSPEQVRGQEVDLRTDFFAFGAILFEMLTGVRAFHKATSADTLAAILQEDPPSLGQLTPAMPPALQRVVLRCLEKNREQRFQSAPDLAFALEALSDSGFDPAVRTSDSGARNPFAAAIDAVAPRRRRSRYAILLAACLMLGSVAYMFRPVMPPPRVSRITQLTQGGGVRQSESLHTDGPRVYYLATGPLQADWQLRQVPLNGGSDTPVAMPPGVFHVSGLSPDDTEFLAISDQDQRVWRIPIGSTSPQQVGDLKADEVAWSHSGALLAYSRQNQIFLAKPDGSGVRPLAATPDSSALVEHLRWSPDDSHLRFTLTTGGPGGSLTFPTKQALWEVASDGSGLHEIKFHWSGNAMECCGEWTADGRYFVFRSSRDGISNLWMLQEEADWWHRPSRDPIALTSGPINYFEPIPSRNGRSILAIGAQPSGELTRYDAATKAFVPYLQGRSLGHLAYSPDGQWLAYVAFPEGTLWRARLDGSDALQLSYPPLRAGSPRWSPDSRKVAFDAFAPGKPLKDFVVSVEGGNPEPLLDEPLSQGRPEWMPTGGSIYSRAYGAPNQGFYRLDPGSHQSQRIPGTDGLYEPLWSPNGRYLAAVDVADGDSLLLLDLKTGKRTHLAGQAWWPAWSPDSRYIYFQRFGVKWILRVRVPDGQEEKFLELPFRVASWPFTVAPDGSLVFLREHGRIDVYSLTLSSQQSEGRPPANP